MERQEVLVGWGVQAVLVELAAECEFPCAQAQCLKQGWGDVERDEAKAATMFATEAAIKILFSSLKIGLKVNHSCSDCKGKRFFPGCHFAI